MSSTRQGPERSDANVCIEKNFKVRLCVSTEVSVIPTQLWPAVGFVHRHVSERNRAINNVRERSICSE